MNIVFNKNVRMIKLLVRVERILFLLLIMHGVVHKASAQQKELVMPVYCEGSYSHHLQGIDMSETFIYWSWTTQLVKTDMKGKLLEIVEVANHHGDLCVVGDYVFVAVNLGEFNKPTGHADSWIYVYDAKKLDFLKKFPVPEVVHGAGGIAWKEGGFFVVGGLPKGYEENYVYEYDEAFRFKARHTLCSGYTRLGIQTITWAKDKWWFGCYGEPAVLLNADKYFSFTSKEEFNASVGIAFICETAYIGRNKVVDGKNEGSIIAGDL